MMALLMVSVALLHFGYRDKLWHIYTPEAFLLQARDGAIMHAGPEAGVHLIQVPLVPLGTHFPALQALAQMPPERVLNNPAAWRDEADRERCGAVVAALTPRELETLKSFAAGLSPQEVADQMVISLNTVNTYKKKILDLCRTTWPERTVIRYHHLKEWFGPYFDQL
jgi:hypothetical protein